MIKVIKTDLEGVVVIEPEIFKDERGYFFESFNQSDFENAIGRTVNFVQDNESQSCYGVLRGLHFQRPPHAQSKLVRCVRGAVLDIVLDIREGSPTYGEHIAVILSEFNHRQLFIPHGFAHGFYVITEEATFQYKCDNFYHPQSDGGILITDEDLNINWPTSMKDAILSTKDKIYPRLKDFKSPFRFLN